MQIGRVSNDAENTILVYDLNKSLIGEYRTQTEASASTGVDRRRIGLYLKGTIGSDEEFVFIKKKQFNEELLNERIEKTESKQTRPFYAITEGNIVGTFTSQTNAADELSCSQGRVWQCLQNYLDTTNGYTFIYCDIYDSLSKNGDILYELQKEANALKIHALLDDITGQKFGRWTVIKRDNEVKDSTYWICRCDCGTVKSVNGHTIKHGESQSCGCLSIELKTTHGKSNTRMYNIWRNMKARCYNPNDDGYYLYGGKGIEICDEWLDNFMTFYNWSMGSGYKEDLTIDRINSNGNYEPNNCRWVDYNIQNNNTNRNHKININGVTKNMAQWCEEHGLHPNLIYSRLKRGMDGEDLLRQPYDEGLYVYKNGVLVGKYKNQTDAAKYIDLSQSNISVSINEKRSIKGYSFAYENIKD